MTVVDRVLDRAAAIVPPSRRRAPGWLRLLAVPAVAAVVLGGIWVTGGLVTDDFAVAQMLTGLWFVTAGALALLVGLRFRALALPVVGTYVVVTVLVGGGLAYTSMHDRVVDERVTVATPERGAGTETGAGAVLRAEGPFAGIAHATTGRARVLERADGSRVLTLTGFETDPGPDLRVYLVPGDGSSVEGHVDLGGLRGNRGDQEYAVPAEVGPGGFGAVVIWCRAFSTAFGAAPLDQV